MKKLFFILLMLPCWCMAQKDTVILVKPLLMIPQPELVQPRMWNIIKKDWVTLPELTNKVVQQSILIDSLQKELLKCQEKSKVDELIIERLFEGIKKEGIIVPTTRYTATYDSLGNIYFKEK